MKRLMIVLTTWIITIGIIIIAVRLFLDPKLKEIIETKGSVAINGTLQVGNVSSQFWPMGLRLSHVLVSRSVPGVSKTNLKIESVIIDVDAFQLIKKIAALRIKILKPQVIHESLAIAAATPQTTYVTTTVNVPADSLAQFFELALNLAVQDGRIEYKSPTQNLVVEDFNFLLDMPTLKSEWKTKLGADIIYGAYKVPVFIEGVLKSEGELLKFSKIKTNVSGIDIFLTGDVNIQSYATKLQAETRIPQIEALHAPIDTGCAKIKSGGLDIKINVAAAELFTSLAIDGQVKIQKLKAELIKCNLQSAQLNGPADLESEVLFKYGKTLSFEKLKLQADLSNLDIKYQELFKKQAQKILQLEVDLTQTGDKFYLRTANMVLDKFRMKAKGMLSYLPGTASDFEVDLAKTNLKGLEELFPILASQPVEGDVELATRVRGDLNRPTDLNVDLNPITLQNIKAAVAWQNADKTMSIKGPIALNLQGNLKVQGTQLQSAHLNANINLNKLNITSPFFVKSDQNILSLDFDSEQSQNKIFIRRGSVLLPGGTIWLTGTVASPQQPVLNLFFKTQKFRLDPLLRMIPAMKAYKISGTTDANLTLGGQYDFAMGIEKSPLNMKGKVSLFLDEVVSTPKAPPAPVKAGSTSIATPTSSEPFLSPWPIYKNSNIQIVSNIKNIKYGDLYIRGVNTTHSFIGGRLLSSGTIQSLFGGRLQLQSSSYNMIERAPTLDFSGRAENLQIGQAVTWVSPAWKDLVRGSANGSFQFTIVHPSVMDYLKLSKGVGAAEIKNGFLSTLSFDQMANEKISKIPGLSSRSDIKLNSKGATGDMSALFTLSDGKINFSKFVVLTPEKNEMRAKGWLDLNKTLDMSADIYLSDPPVRGSVREANSDPTGRLMLPIKISGNIFSPSIDVTNDTIKVLLEKTARLEAAKLQKKASQEIQKQGQKLGNDLKKEAEKKLKDLFK